jgi:phosphate starvation-inducible protein PhoH
LARAPKNKNNNAQHSIASKNSLSLSNIQPITKNQKLVFDSYYAGKHLFLTGSAGCGKTYLAMGLALKEIINDSDYDKILIVRSVVPTRDMGFLPGSIKEKIKIYEEPYHAICSELFGRGDSYDLLKNKGVLEFTTTSYLRGLTFRNAIVIIDEVQNLTFHECDSLITRVGPDTKILFCGDMKQSDLVSYRETSGMFNFLRIIKSIKSFDVIEFGLDDIVRSDLVKEYLIAKDKFEN